MSTQHLLEKAGTHKEHHEPRRQCFCASWHWRLVFWPQNKCISRTRGGTFLCQVRRSNRFLTHRADKQAERQKQAPLKALAMRLPSNDGRYWMKTRRLSRRRLRDATTLAWQGACSAWHRGIVSGSQVGLQMSSYSRQMKKVVLRHRVLVPDSMQKGSAIRLRQ